MAEELTPTIALPTYVACVGASISGSLHNRQPPPTRCYNDGAEASVRKSPLPLARQLVKYLMALPALVPNSMALFIEGAVLGATVRTLMVPLDRFKPLMQTHRFQILEGSGKKGIGSIKALAMIRNQEGEVVNGDWVMFVGI